MDITDSVNFIYKNNGDTNTTFYLFKKHVLPVFSSPKARTLKSIFGMLLSPGGSCIQPWTTILVDIVRPRLKRMRKMSQFIDQSQSTEK